MATAKERVVFIQDDNGLFKTLVQGNQIQILTLPHPRHGPISYIECQNIIYEIQSFTPNRHRSWFINQRVSSDPGFLLATKIDPRFLILPCLEMYGQKYSPLDQIVTVQNGCNRIPLNNMLLWKMEEICDINDKLGDDMILFRYNESKVLQLLRTKVIRLAKHLYIRQKVVQSQNMYASNFNPNSQMSIVSSSTDNLSASNEVPRDYTDDTIMQSLNVILEYISSTSTIIEKLLSSFSLTIDMLNEKNTSSTSHKRKADWETALEVCNSAVLEMFYNLF
jgi:hypothetical protein